MIVAAAIAAVGSMLGDPLVWIERALVVLVAASPCALAIAIPVTVVAAIGAASKLGVLVKGGAALEAVDPHRALRGVELVGHLAGGDALAAALGDDRGELGLAAQPLDRAVASGLAPADELLANRAAIPVCDQIMAPIDGRSGLVAMLVTFGRRASSVGFA